MADDIPISTFSSLRTAAVIHDATIAEGRRFVLPDSAATRHPASTLGRSFPAKTSGEVEIDECRIFSKHFNLRAIRVELGSGRQSGFIHTDRVSAHGRHLQNGNSQAIS